MTRALAMGFARYYDRRGMPGFAEIWVTYARRLHDA